MINLLTQNTPLAAPITPSLSTTKSAASSTDTAPPSPPKSLEVSLSPEATKKAAEEKKRNADIDASPLPDGIKDSLKAIREIQQKIAEKLEELTKLASDKSLNAETREKRNKQLQIEISSLTNALSTAESALNKVMSAQNLSADDRKLANGLIGK
jgi:uncharacterized phage infection (PIP) family protein YhgE